MKSFSIVYLQGRVSAMKLLVLRLLIPQLVFRRLALI